MAVKNISGQGHAPASGRISDSIVTPNAAKISNAQQVSLPKPGMQGPTGSASGVDVAVSDKARSRIAEQKKAKEIAMATPDVREDRVAAIKAKMAEGTYKVDSEKIANGMVREALMDHLTSEPSR